MARTNTKQERTTANSLVVKLADKFGVDADKLLHTLKATAFRQRDGIEITTEQLMVLLIVADTYNLNPFTKELYAYPDKNNGIIPVVSVDGWSRIVNENPAYDGVDFTYSEEMVETGKGGKKAHAWIECALYRKDRAHPTRVREYIDEVYREPIIVNRKNGNGTYEVQTPWQTHTKRLHRHKTFIQSARIAFGFAGIYDQDEAERIIEAEVAHEAAANSEPPKVDHTQGNKSVRNKLAAKLGDVVETKIEGSPGLIKVDVDAVNAACAEARAEHVAS